MMLHDKDATYHYKANISQYINVSNQNVVHLKFINVIREIYFNKKQKHT